MVVAAVDPKSQSKDESYFSPMHVVEIASGLDNYCKDYKLSEILKCNPVDERIWARVSILFEHQLERTRYLFDIRLKI